MLCADQQWTKRTSLYAGGSTRSAINKSVTLVVHGGEAHSNKLAKATEYGIDVWTEEAWNSFLKQHHKGV
jgi:NAD-dependent DNA ligase